MIEFGPEICRDFQAATKKEWLETNGIGGYAASTIVLTNTRRYHGLLVTADRFRDRGLAGRNLYAIR